MSSRVIWNKENDKWKDGFRVHLEEQTALIHKLIAYLEKITFDGVNRFQQAMIITLKATLSLHKLLVEKYGVTYLLTSRLLQDALEAYNDTRSYTQLTECDKMLSNSWTLRSLTLIGTFHPLSFLDQILSFEFLSEISELFSR